MKSLTRAQIVYPVPGSRRRWHHDLLGSTDPEFREAVELLLRADALLAFGESLLGLALPRGGDTSLMTDTEIQARFQSALGSAYRLERELGGGGMSRVYVAEETAFRRNVVVKVLRAELAEVISAKRFEREIQLAARLQHPHIVPLLSAGEVDGLLYYTMPFVEGESLRDRLRRQGELPIDAAIRIVRDVASALAYAHRRGVIHRDIKPENVLLSEGGAVVADFGIAKALIASRTRGEDATATTLTQRGTSVGTPLYMAPEQATGDPMTDHRVDIYALGVVAYELLAGRPPFDGRSSQQLMAAHATEVPEPITRRRPATPSAFAELVMRCLEKRPADRPQEANELLATLDTLHNDSPRPASAAMEQRAVLTRTPIPQRLRWTVGAVAIAAAALAARAFARRSASQVTAQPVQLDIALPDSAAPDVGDRGRSIALSGDGSVVAYLGSPTKSVFVRPLDESVPRRLPGTEGAVCPSFSPDGQWIVFTSGGRLKKIALRGGMPIVIADSAGWCGIWTDRNEVIFDLRNELFRVSADGGPVSLVARPDLSKGLGYMVPSQALPGGDHALINLSSAFHVDYQVGLVSLRDGQVTRLTTPGMPRFDAQYSNGYIVFAQLDDRVIAAPFSLRTLRFTGPEVTILGSAASFSVANARMTYLVGSGLSLGLVAVGEGGRMRAIGGNAEGTSRPSTARTPLDTAWYSWPRLSPDGKRVALEMATGPFTWDIWIYDIGTRTLTRLTSGFGGMRPAGWTQDGQSVVFFALDSGYRSYNANRRIVSQRWDGSAPPRELMKLPSNVHDVSVRPPHPYAVYSVLKPPRTSDIWIAPVDTPQAARPLAATSGIEGQPGLSPDGKLVAYTSTETGRPEIYVQPVPGPGRRLQVSAGGGSQAVWSSDGRHVFYRGPNEIIRATLMTDSTLSVVRRETLFQDMYEQHDMQNYDVFPGGKELLMIRVAGKSSWRAAIVLNWPELVRQRLEARP